MNNITFTVNIYDQDGDIVEKCILLHVNDAIIIKLSDMSELDNMIKELQTIKTEIQEKY